MNQRPLLTDLIPGDVLCYDVRSLFNLLVAIKTWSRDCTHTETYIGGGLSVASRIGVGVGTYGTRLNDLSYVLRPKEPFDLTNALAWHDGCKGQKYDWKGLLVFMLAVSQGAQDRMFCSEHTTRFQRQGGIVPFQEEVDADAVSPANFKTSVAYWRFWKRS